MTISPTSERACKRFLIGADLCHPDPCKDISGEISNREKNHRLSIFVNASPDGNYAIRILEAYLQDSLWKWKSGTNEPLNPLYVEMNKHQDLRAKELREAIQVLSKAKSGK